MTEVTNQKGANPRQAAKRVWGELTAREAEVAELIAAGYSNGEIAEEMVIGKKTVENKVSEVYQKLGIGGRNGLGRVRVRIIMEARG